MAPTARLAEQEPEEEGRLAGARRPAPDVEVSLRERGAEDLRGGEGVAPARTEVGRGKGERLEQVASSAHGAPPAAILRGGRDSGGRDPGRALPASAGKRASRRRRRSSEGLQPAASAFSSPAPDASRRPRPRRRRAATGTTPSASLRGRRRRPPSRAPTNRSTRASTAGAMCGSRKRLRFSSAARLPGGRTPFEYFPVSTPWASGLNTHWPTPSRRDAGSTSASIRRSSRLYSGWLTTGPYPPAARATFTASAICAPVHIDTPHASDLALAHEVLHRAHGLLERRLRVEPVALVDVDVVGAQAPEARVARLHHVLAREPAVVGPLARRPEHLRREHDVLPRDALERAPEQLLRLAERVDVGGVERLDARVERGAHARARAVLVDARPEGQPRPEDRSR